MDTILAEWHAKCSTARAVDSDLHSPSAACKKKPYHFTGESGFRGEEAAVGDWRRKDFGGMLARAKLATAAAKTSPHGGQQIKQTHM